MKTDMASLQFGQKYRTECLKKLQIILVGKNIFLKTSIDNIENNTKQDSLNHWTRKIAGPYIQVGSGFTLNSKFGPSSLFPPYFTLAKSIFIVLNWELCTMWLKQSFIVACVDNEHLNFWLTTGVPSLCLAHEIELKRNKIIIIGFHVFV